MRLVKSLLLLLCLSSPGFATTADTPPAKPAKEIVRLNADLAYRAQFGRAEDITLLVNEGASPNAANANGIPALAIAAQRWEEEGVKVMQVLLKERADINVKDTEGRTALFHAARIGNLTAVKFLLQQGADYSITNNNGDHPRNIAFRERHTEVFQYFDIFIKEQNEKVNQQYVDAGKQVVERYTEAQQGVTEQRNALAEERRKLEEEKRLLEAEKQKIAEIDLKKMNAKLEERNEKARKEVMDLQELYESGEFEKTVRDLASNACGFEYWAFVSKRGTASELAPDARREQINAHRDKVEALQREMMELYKVNRKYVNGITQPAQKKTLQQLRAMGSNATLASRGVGTKKDAETRCRAIAESFDVTTHDTGITPLNEQDIEEKPARKGGGNQPMGGGGAMRLEGIPPPP